MNIALLYSPPSDNIADAFNNHFKNWSDVEVDNSDSNFRKYFNSSSPCSMYMMPTNINEVKNILKNLKSNSPGHDDISPKILKHCYDTLSIPLTHTINLSLKHGGFPDHLKRAKGVLIHKSGHLQDIKNYRPISILSALSKIYKKK